MGIDWYERKTDYAADMLDGLIVLVVWRSSGSEPVFRCYITGRHSVYLDKTYASLEEAKKAAEREAARLLDAAAKEIEGNA